jgi:hypothetical protein
MSFLINPSISIAPVISTTYINSTSSTGGPSTITFGSVSVNGQGLIVVTFSGQFTVTTLRTLNSVTIGGQSATINIQKHQAGTSTGSLSAIASVNYTGTPTTVSVVLVFNGTVLGPVLGVYRVLNNKNNTPIATASTGGTSTTSVLTVNFAGLDTGSKFFLGVSSNYVARTNTWSSSFSMVENYDITQTGGNGSAARSNSTGTSGFVTTTFSGTLGNFAGTLCAVVIA